MIAPYYDHAGITIFCGDCREVLPQLGADSVDSIVTDPPYGLSFMGKDWDRGVPGEHFWREAIRVAKPGAHLLAFGGTRTFHRLACAIEDAGWEIRDCVMWVYGSGFPKSMDVSKAIDKAAGAEREISGTKTYPDGNSRVESWPGGVNGLEGWQRPGAPVGDRPQRPMTDPATDAAKQWQGWGTALKPAWEPIIVARKPVVGTVAANVLLHGTGGINVDGCRIAGEPWTRSTTSKQDFRGGKLHSGASAENNRVESAPQAMPISGRWPANLIHDGSQDALAAFPDSNGQQGAVGPQHGERPTVNAYGNFGPRPDFGPRRDSGSASRFFYCAKASRKDRSKTNTHTTVKPTALMKYLCRLVTPPDGLVLDPFMGSGSTGKAARLEGFNFVGIEQDDAYCAIAAKRMPKGLLF